MRRDDLELLLFLHCGVRLAIFFSMCVCVIILTEIYAINLALTRDFGFILFLLKWNEWNEIVRIHHCIFDIYKNESQWNRGAGRGESRKDVQVTRRHLAHKRENCPPQKTHKKTNEQMAADMQWGIGDGSNCIYVQRTTNEKTKSCWRWVGQWLILSSLQQQSDFANSK